MERIELIQDIQKVQHQSGINKNIILSVEDRTDEELQSLWNYLCGDSSDSYHPKLGTPTKNKEYLNKTILLGLPKHPNRLKPTIEQVEKGMIKVTQKGGFISLDL